MITPKNDHKVIKWVNSAKCKRGDCCILIERRSMHRTYIFHCQISFIQPQRMIQFSLFLSWLASKFILSCDVNVINASIQRISGKWIPFYLTYFSWALLSQLKVNRSSEIVVIAFWKWSSWLLNYPEWLWIIIERISFNNFNPPDVHNYGLV